MKNFKRVNIEFLFQLLLGVFSGIIGFLISPQNKISDSLRENSNVITFWSIDYCISVCFISYANGFNLKMFSRSKADFAVNVAVSSFCGCILALSVMYLTQMSLVGRWVSVTTPISYFCLVVIYYAVRNKNRDRPTYIFGPQANQFGEFVKWFRLVKEGESEILINSIPLKSDLLKITSGDEVGQVYITDPINQSVNINFDSIRNDKKFAKLIYPVDLIIESEIEVCNINSFRNENWWDADTILRRSSYCHFKRLTDLMIVLLFSIPSIIVVSLVCFLILVTDGGPCLYKQRRLGQYGIAFDIIKLRTMRRDSEKHGAQWASLDDDRVIWLGKILRKTRFDELPQLWNILVGDMSFIGPRPERPEFYDLIDKNFPQFRLRLAAKPGLTGWAQVNYHYGASVNDSMIKMCYDIYYLKHVGIILDLRIALRTVVAMVRGAR
jgi:lipopolysaccharide/colanic/teichoic acid biosynthesis glycosyltransferase